MNSKQIDIPISGMSCASCAATIKKLIGLQAKSARVVRDGEEMDIPVEEVEIG